MEKENQTENVEKKRIVITLDHLLLIIALIIIVIIAWAGTLKDSEEVIDNNTICEEVEDTEVDERIYINTDNPEVNSVINKMFDAMEYERFVAFSSNGVVDYYHFSSGVSMHVNLDGSKSYKTFANRNLMNIKEILKAHQLNFLVDESLYTVELIDETDKCTVIARKEPITEKYYINKNTELLEIVEIIHEDDDTLNTFCNVSNAAFEIPDELNPNSFRNIDIEKPVIYIYPESKTEVEVKLGNPEKLTTTYPEYKNGWKVIANPDGTLEDLEIGREYYCLYWEGKNDTPFEYREGFVVEGEDTAEFLEEKLEILGLNEKEAQEFIIYWLPQMEDNKYNYIRFQTEDEIEEDMPLEVKPVPETTIRVLMEWEALDEEIEVEEQQLEKVERKGYTVVEWGGTKRK